MHQKVHPPNFSLMCKGIHKNRVLMLGVQDEGKEDALCTWVPSHVRTLFLCKFHFRSWFLPFSNKPGSSLLPGLIYLVHFVGPTTSPATRYAEVGPTTLPAARYAEVDR
jgi:hypothetical protein